MAHCAQLDARRVDGAMAGGRTPLALGDQARLEQLCFNAVHIQARRGSLRPGQEASVSAEMTLARWLPGQQVIVQQLGLSTCSFWRTGSAYALVMSQEIFGRGGRMYREGCKQKEIRMAIDDPSGAHDDDPEQAGDSKPDKEHGHGKQQPAEVRSRAEYYEELRATDKQMSASDGRSDRPALDSLHVAPERAKHILDGDRWGGGHRHGTGRPGKTNCPLAGTTRRSSGTSWAWPALQTIRPCSRPTADGGCMAIVDGRY